MLIYGVYFCCFLSEKLIEASSLYHLKNFCIFCSNCLILGSNFQLKASASFSTLLNSELNRECNLNLSFFEVGGRDSNH